MPDSPPRLAHLRVGIDGVDDLLVLTLAIRRALVMRVGQLKRRHGLATVDAGREQAVRRRAQRLAARLGVPGATVEAVLGVVIDDARRSQAERRDLDQCGGPAADRTIVPVMQTIPSLPRWLRVIPPPRRLAPVARCVPVRLQRVLVERAVAHALAAPTASGLLDFMRGRRLGIEVGDLGLRWTFALRADRLEAVDDAPEATVRGSATDLLLLAARLEDADTLFFQRRLVLTGDTELGLTARNVLDRLPWDSLPLALRIVLHRAAGLARDARDLHRTNRESAA